METRFLCVHHHFTNIHWRVFNERLHILLCWFYFVWKLKSLWVVWRESVCVFPENRSCVTTDIEITHQGVKSQRRKVCLFSTKSQGYLVQCDIKPLFVDLYNKTQDVSAAGGMKTAVCSLYLSVYLKELIQCVVNECFLRNTVPLFIV